MDHWSDAATTTTVPKPNPVKALIPDPWDVVRGIYSYAGDWAVANWPFVVLLVLVGTGWLAWRTFREAVWGH